MVPNGFVAAYVATFFLACSQSAEEAGKGDPMVSAGDSGKLQVTATVNMVSDLVRQVGGDHVELTEIMGPGVDPHLYKASANDVTKLQNAEIIFYVGLLLEGKMEEVLGKLKDGGKPVPLPRICKKPSCSIRASTRITLTRTFGLKCRCGKRPLMWWSPV